MVLLQKWENLEQLKDFMRKDYAEMFKNTPNLHCDIKNRTVLGNTVIDHEVVSGFGPNHLEAIAIYEIKNDKIAKVYFIQKQVKKNPRN